MSLDELLKVSTDRMVNVHPYLITNVRVIIRQLYDEGLHFAVFMGYRSLEVQDALYSQGRFPLDVVNAKRKQAGLGSIDVISNKKKVTNARAGQSWHNYGLACFSKDTEVLTDEGWKFFSDLTQKELVLSFNEGVLRYEKPIAYIQNKFNGDIINIKNRSIDLLVTPNHKMVCKTREDADTGKWKYVRAENLNDSYKIPCSGKYLSDNYSYSEPPIKGVSLAVWWEFMGWYLSEGFCCGVSDGKKRQHNSRYKISISQSKNSKYYSKIKKCLDQLPYYNNYIGHEFIIHSKELWEILFPLGNSYTKRIPRYLLKAPLSLLQLLYEAMISGDGSIYDKHDSYFSVNRELINDFSELCVLLGKPFSIIERKTVVPHIMPQGRLLKNINPQYQLNTRTNSTIELRNGNEKNKHFSKDCYIGDVFCVTVPSGSVVVRRNGKVAICGNCDLVEDGDTSKLGVQWSWANIKSYLRIGKVVSGYPKIEWGGLWQMKDYPHVQLTNGLGLSEAKNLYNLGGLEGVWKEIDARM